MTGFIKKTQPKISKAEKMRLSQAIHLLMDLDNDIADLQAIGKELGWPDEYTELVANHHLLRIDLRYKTDEDYSGDSHGELLRTRAAWDYLMRKMVQIQEDCGERLVSALLATGNPKRLHEVI